MANYLWEYQGLGPRVGVTKEPKGSIFLKDKTRPYKAWWNGGGINQGTKTLEESKRFALEYVRDYVKERHQEAVELIGKAALVLAEIENQLK